MDFDPTDRFQFCTDEEHLLLCIKSEYYKRSSVKEAYENVNKMIESEKELYLKLSRKEGKRRARHDSEINENPVKRAHFDGSSDEEYCGKVAQSVERTDSDQSDVDRNSPDNMQIFEFASLRYSKVKKEYAKLAEEEISGILSHVKESGDELSGGYVLKLLAIRRICSVPLSDKLLPRIDKLHVIISFHGISFQMYNSKMDKWVVSNYSSHSDGCFCWYGDHLHFIRNEKFQNRAALDLFYLVKHREARFKELKFSIERWSHWNPKVRPYDKFFGKIRNLLDSLSYKLNVKAISMDHFSHPDDSVFGSKILLSIWPFLKMDVLESIRLRKWNDDHLEKRSTNGFDSLDWTMWKKDRWINVKHMDIGEGIDWRPFDRFKNFETIRMQFTMDDFDKFLMHFEDYPPARVTIYPGPDFDFQTAIKKLDYQQKLILPDTYCLENGLVVRFVDCGDDERKIIFMRRDRNCAR